MMFRQIRRDQSGTSALEFALVAPVYFLFLIGSVSISMMLFSIGSMHYAVQEAARCASVQTTVCTDASTTTSFAQGKYYGTVSPTFVYAADTCGKKVTATATYAINVILFHRSIPLSATACFP